MAPWAHSWGTGEMYAGVGINGAEDAWMDLAILVEHWQLCGTPFSGGDTDIAKCFDQIDRDLLLAIAQKAGMPTRILDTYRRFMSQLMLHNTIAGGIGRAYKRGMGIPQGCPPAHDVHRYYFQTLGQDDDRHERIAEYAR